MSTIRNLSGVPESPLMTGSRRRHSTAEDSPRAMSALSLGPLRGLSMRRLHGHGLGDDEGEDPPVPPHLTFDDDVPVFPPRDAAPLFAGERRGGENEESKEREIAEYRREVEEEEREVARQEATQRPSWSGEGASSRARRRGRGSGERAGGTEREAAAERQEAARTPPDEEGSDLPGEGTSQEGDGGGRHVEGEDEGTERDDDGATAVGDRPSANNATPRRPIVSFSDKVIEFVDGDEPRSRPSLIVSKLPAPMDWEAEDGSDAGDDAPAAPPVHRGAAAARPDPLHGFLARLNPFDDLSWSLIGHCLVRTAPCFWHVFAQVNASVPVWEWQT